MTKANAKRKKSRRATSPVSAAKRRAPRQDMRMVAVVGRIRQHPWLTLEQAKHERASTALGLAYLKGDIDDTLYRAGEEYKRLHDAYMRALNAPDGFAVSDCGDGGSETSDEYVEWAIRSVGHFEAIRASLVDQGAFIATVTESLVIKDAEQEPSHIGYAKQGLRFLSTKLGIST